MKSALSLRMNKNGTRSRAHSPLHSFLPSRRSRRGFTLTEVVVAGSLLLVVMSGMAGMMSIAGVMELSTTLQSDTDRNAAKAIQRMTLEVREAKRVQILAAHWFRVYYPVQTAEGPFDRFREDSTHYVEFMQGDAAGNANPAGTCLWRRTEAGNDRIIAQDMQSMVVQSVSPHTIVLTVELYRVAGRRYGSTRLTNRVLYLRNN